MKTLHDAKAVALARSKSHTPRGQKRRDSSGKVGDEHREEVGRLWSVVRCFWKFSVCDMRSMRVWM